MKEAVKGKILPSVAVLFKGTDGGKRSVENTAASEMTLLPVQPRSGGVSGGRSSVGLRALISGDPRGKAAFNIHRSDPGLQASNRSSARGSTALPQLGRPPGPVIEDLPCRSTAIPSPLST